MKTLHLGRGGLQNRPEIFGWNGRSVGSDGGEDFLAGRVYVFYEFDRWKVLFVVDAVFYFRLDAALVPPAFVRPFNVQVVEPVFVDAESFCRVGFKVLFNNVTPLSRLPERFNAVFLIRYNNIKRLIKSLNIPQTIPVADVESRLAVHAVHYAPETVQLVTDDFSDLEFKVTTVTCFRVNQPLPGSNDFARVNRQPIKVAKLHLRVQIRPNLLNSTSISLIRVPLIDG
mmetsp:Transcript_54/g.112  ORF Transcript_54/g.112 Transcript_54/m.112 type:complete len:228 (+) Transcript_54:533-1216(+)